MIALKNILVATDFSESSNAALVYGRDLARLYGSALHLLHVVGDVATQAITPVGIVPDIGRLQMEMEQEAYQRLDESVEENGQRPQGVKTTVMTSGTPAHAILAYAKAAEIDLIVVGTHGRTGLTHLLMGSVAEHVVRSAPCPVLTVRQNQRQFIRSDAAQCALATA